MTKRLLLVAVVLISSFSISKAQTAEELVDKYLSAIGGKKKLSEIQSLRMLALVKAQGMEMPAELLKKSPNMMKMTLSFQGYEIVQPAFDGENGWATNFMTMENEEMDPDGSLAMKQEAQDFPDPFYNYASKGYIVGRKDDVTENGKEYFVLLLEKNTVIVNGEELSNNAEYLLDKSTFLPYKRSSLAEGGPTKGMAIETIYSNYKEIEGFRFPYIIEQKVNGVTQATMNFEMVEINPPIENKEFKFPEQP